MGFEIGRWSISRRTPFFLVENRMETQELNKDENDKLDRKNEISFLIVNRDHVLYALKCR